MLIKKLIKCKNGTFNAVIINDDGEKELVEGVTVGISEESGTTTYTFDIVGVDEGAS